MREEPCGAGKTKVKICGITRAEEIACVNQCCPDYIGFVFAKKSRRFIARTDAARLRERLNPSIQAVGVFVDEDPQVVAELLRERVIDMAQLHGGEDADYLRELSKLTDRPLIKAFYIRDTEGLIKARESTAEYLLFDSSKAGSGTTFDWSILGHIGRPYFLAGGLDPGNVTEALERVNPFAVDVSSGVETNGEKDSAKITQFVQSVRDWNRREQHDK